MESLGTKFNGCQICQSANLYKFLSLGHHPNPDGFLSEEQLKEPEIYYPLDVFFCENCKLVQLQYAPNPSALFTEDFVYTTGSSKELVDNFRSLSKIILKRFNPSSDDLIVEIGSNDGTMLSNFVRYNFNILGIDPSRAADLAEEKNVPTLKDFFNGDTAKRVLSEKGNAKIISASNVFAHVQNLDSFMEGIKILLKDRGTFIQESGYIKTLIEHNQYDSIYVEHLRYYSLKSLINLFNKFEMDVFDAEIITTHGGSIRTYACKKGQIPVSKNVQKILKNEEETGIHALELYEGFGEAVKNNREELKRIIFNIKSQGKKIAGIGAPAKGNTLLNYCKIGNETIGVLLEKESLKIGKYSPGMHIPIVNEEILFGNNPPDAALLLSWNLEKVIVPKLREKGYKGTIIVPNPKPRILGY